jgi:hypothetical protein
MTRNIGFGLLLSGNTKHLAQDVVAAHDGAYFLSFFFCSRMLRRDIRSWWANSIELLAFKGRATALR